MRRGAVRRTCAGQGKAIVTRKAISADTEVHWATHPKRLLGDACYEDAVVHDWSKDGVAWIRIVLSR